MIGVIISIIIIGELIYLLSMRSCGHKEDWLVIKFFSFFISLWFVWIYSNLIEKFNPIYLEYIGIGIVYILLIVIFCLLNKKIGIWLNRK